MLLSAFFSLLFVVRLCGYTRIWYPRRDLFSLTRRASKSRESTRRRKFMRKDRMTVCKDTQRQIKLKSLKVPLFQYAESAVEYHQRPGASISEFKPSAQWEAPPGKLPQLPPPCSHAALIFTCAGTLIAASMVLFCTGAPKDLIAGLSLTLGIAVSTILSATWQRKPSATATWRRATWTHALVSEHAVIPPVLPVFRPHSSSPMSTCALVHTSGNAAVLQQHLSAAYRALQASNPCQS